MFGTCGEVYGWTRNKYIADCSRRCNTEYADIVIREFDCSFSQFAEIMHDDYQIADYEMYDRELRIITTKSGKYGLVSKYWFDVVNSEIEAIYSELECIADAYYILRTLKPYFINPEISVFMDFILIKYLRDFIRDYEESYFHGTTTDVLALILDGGYLLEL